MTETKYTAGLFVGGPANGRTIEVDATTSFVEIPSPVDKSGLRTTRYERVGIIRGLEVWAPDGLSDEAVIELIAGP